MQTTTQRTTTRQLTTYQITGTDRSLDPAAVLWLRQAVRESQTILVAWQAPGLPESARYCIDAINAGLREAVCDTQLDALIATAIRALGAHFQGPVEVELSHCPYVNGPAVLFVPAAVPQSPAPEPVKEPAPGAAYH